MQKTDLFVVATWSAFGFGLIEGLALDATRAVPALAAPYKLSAHVLWVAPVLNIALFLLAAVAMMPILHLLRRRLSNKELLSVFGVFAFLGLFGIISAPRLASMLSGALLALGLAVTLSRKLAGSEDRLVAGMRRRLFLIPTMILLLAFGVAGYDKASEMWRARQLPVARAGAPNVLVIVMDTVRYDSFIKSQTGSLTPNLDRIAAQGVRFENAWSSSSWTLPSQASILTGLYPHQHGADWPRLRLDAGQPTLAGFFSQQGYATGAFSGNSVWIAPEYVGRGFLRFNTYMIEDLFRRTSYGRALNLVLRNLRLHESGRGKPAAQVNAELLRFLDTYSDRPFLAYLCYMDVNRTFHNRWLNYGFLQKTAPLPEVKQAYDVGLTELDRQIGMLYAELERRGILQNTLVIITSDHGESFGEEIGDHNPIGHGTSLYPEQTRVPLFVISPGRAPAGREEGGLASIRQIPSTITTLLNLPDAPFAGPSLLPSEQTADQALLGADELLMTLNYADRKMQAVLWDDWLYINNGMALLSPSGEELYDRTTDPMADHNLASSQDLVRPRVRLQYLLDTPFRTTSVSEQDTKGLH